MLADPRRQTVSDGEQPPIRTWADVQKQRQVQKLDIEIAALQGKVMPIEEVKAAFTEYAGVVRGALENLVQRVAAERRDPELLGWAEQARDAALRGIEAAI